MPVSTNSSKTCILIPTFAGYIAVAAITRSLLSRYWPQHPAIFFAGLPESLSPGPCLPLRSEVKDWCSIVADACDDLAEMGYTDVYLILDDHPPLNLCHCRHLNTTLPMLRAEFDATFIGLNGWGYGRSGRKVTGTICPPKYWNMEHVNDAFAWRYSLHPGLWCLERLGALARAVETLNPPGERSAWNFERTANKGSFAADLGFANTCYRVCGYRMTASSTRYLRYRAAYLSVLLYKRLQSTLSGRPLTVDATLDAIGYYYEGPYPLFWSGLIVQGRFNPALSRHIAIARRRDLSALLSSDAMKRFSAPSPDEG
ncbi:MAG: hypothetical protein WAL83_03050 [Arenicellales bacterium]